MSLQDLEGVSGHLFGVDPETGDETAVPVYLAKPRSSSSVKWLLLWQPTADQRGGGLSMYEQAIEGKLTLTDYRVRDYLLCMCGIGNFVHFNQSAASRELSIAQPNISKSISKLVKMGIVLEGPKSGKFKTYQINPALAFSGGLRDGAKAQRKSVESARAGKVFQFSNFSK